MFLLFAIYGTRICLADKSSSSISASKSEVKQNNDALVIVLCVSVAHMVFYNQSPIVWMVNTTFGFLLSPGIRSIFAGTHQNDFGNGWASELPYFIINVFNYHCYFRLF